jgi:serine/tyrosine/threonine adenylyltransferase
MRLPFENTYAQLPARFFVQVHPTAVARPSLLALNTELATRLELAEPPGPSQWSYRTFCGT